MIPKEMLKSMKDRTIWLIDLDKEQPLSLVTVNENLINNCDFEEYLFEHIYDALQYVQLKNEMYELANGIWKRRWANKYFKMRRKEQPGLLFPDGDEVYKRYFKQKKQIKKLKRDLNFSKRIINDLLQLKEK